MEPTIIEGAFSEGRDSVVCRRGQGFNVFPVRIRGTVTHRAYGSRNLFVGVSWKREDCWNGGICKGDFFRFCHGMRLFQLQSIENIAFFSHFSFLGLYSWGIALVMSLGL